MNKDRIHTQQMIAIAGGMPRYIRKGKCVQCGSCCINENCEHLQWLENGKAFCNIHNRKDRPKKCIIYPANPPLNFFNCGYYFIDKTNNKKIRLKV